ncbi:TetR/AcrR family transcriptional regulator [Celeribacter ethanolicus]|uniref:TetR/AcrR family transcriptional regulator n=1 Tax=Celeribacter ethanolicus TaxID=1758178 RepID=UPI000836FC46|nr:TetR/AcrR family transcriptional regulator [Celeribacter ethanolicus]
MSKYEAEPEEAAAQETGVRKRGRPVQMDFEARETVILDATHALMMERGFDHVTMSAIARRAGMSKRTLYAHFDSQEVLLGRVIARISASIFQPLPEEDQDRPFSERLDLLLTFNKPPGSDRHKLEFLRTMVARAQTYPALARGLVHEGRGRLTGYVRDEIMREITAGRLSLAPDQAALSADLIVSMAFGDPLVRLLDPEFAEPTPELLAERRALAVRLFLTGCAVKMGDDA